MSFAVRVATASDRAAVAELVSEMIPGVDPDARLRWLYEGNPAGPAVTWLAHEGNAIAGVTSYFPFRLRLDGREVRAALGGDGFVRPQFRRRGVGGLLHEAARRAMSSLEFGCMYGAPGSMNVSPLKHGGAREVGHVARWVRPLRGAPLGVRVPPFDQMIRGILRPRFVPHLDPMVRGDRRIDDIWCAAVSSLRLGAVRDTAFYTWRFIDAPAHREPAYVVMLRGRAIAACALERMHGGKTVRIVDLIAIPGKWHAALSAIARHAAETDAHRVDIKLMVPDGRARRMWRSGFVARDEKPFLVSIPDGGDPRFLDPQRWFYCGADSDLDALE